MHDYRHRRRLPAVVLGLLFPIALFPQSAFRGSSDNSETVAGNVPDSSSTPPGVTSAPAVAPQPHLSHQEMGDIHLVWHRYMAALKEYRQVEPRTSAIWNGMGVVYQMLYDNKDAIRCYKQAIRLDPANVPALNNLGTVYFVLKDYWQAEPYYRRALKANPKSAPALMNLGTDLLMQHKYAEGQKMYALAIAADPDIFSRDRGTQDIASSAPVHELGRANYLKARSCAFAGQADCALENLRRAISEGAVDIETLAAEHDFDGIRDTAEFQRLVKIAK